MKPKSSYLIIFLLSISLIWTGCKKDTEDDEPAIISNTNPNVEYLTNTGSFTYTKNLGTTPVDVYFIFTNTSLSQNKTSPTISSSMENGSKDNLLNELDITLKQENEMPKSGFIIIDKPHITEFNRVLPGQIDSNNFQSGTIEPPPPYFDTVGDSVTLYNDKYPAGTIPAQCKSVVSNGTKTLNIYVANDCWTGAPAGKTFYITQSMVDALADKFLLSGANNDVYDWVTNIYGAEWGTHIYSNLIPPNDEITILLYDIDGDHTVGQDGAFVAGYFYARDNYKKTTATGYVTDYSNERIMFAIDAVLFANNNNTGGMADDSSGWTLSDPWPQKLIGTLAHEFQHMIHFYQKNVKYNTDSETWLNEMCSLVTEDLVADKLQISGPRNVAYNDPSAGSSGNNDGRLPLYNYYNNEPANNWNQYLKNYSINYALGAYLARNFGGAQFFKNVVQCGYGSEDAIEYALSKTAGNTDRSFAVILRKWAVANLLSDQTDTPVADHTAYNNGNSWFTDALNYNLGSINLYNYHLSSPSQTGPRIYTTMPGILYFSSNTYYEAATNVTGTKTWNITAPAGVTTTVVIKD